MTDERFAKDRNGKQVRVGDAVRIVALDPTFMHALPQDEIADVRSMIGAIFKIEEIDDYGSAWVSKWWDRGENRSESHCIALAAVEMELVSSENAN
jgi:hypothetical protein